MYWTSDSPLHVVSVNAFRAYVAVFTVRSSLKPAFQEVISLQESDRGVLDDQIIIEVVIDHLNFCANAKF